MAGNAGAHFVEAHNDSVQGYTLLFNETFGSHWDTDNADIVASGLIASQNLAAGAFVEKSEGPVTISNSYMCSGNPATGTTTVGFNLRNSEQVTLDSDVMANNVENFLVEGQAGGIQVTNWETGQVYNLVSQNFSASNNILANGPGQKIVLDGYLGDPTGPRFEPRSPPITTPGGTLKAILSSCRCRPITTPRTLPAGRPQPDKISIPPSRRHQATMMLPARFRRWAAISGSSPAKRQA